MISRKWLAALVSLAVVLTALFTGPVAYADEESVNFEDAMQKVADIARGRANGDVSLDRVIVIYDRPSSINDAQRLRVRQLAGARLLSADRTLARDVLRVPGANAALVAQVLRAVPGVRDAYPDLVARIVAPADPLFSDPAMYGITKIDAETAWQTSTAPDVKVAVLDCGIAAHEDLPVIPADVTRAKDFALSGSTDDRCNHGTHVAGTIAALTNNGIGVASVAHGATLLNGKVLGNSGSGSFADIDAGIRWAADNGAKVINLSLGATASCPTGTRDAVAYARSKGALVVAAAGNSNANGAITPANCQYAVGVAATDQNDNKASFSNFGPNVDVAAPGVGILSTVNPAVNTGVSGCPNPCLYRAFSGTSMASPHAAAVAALIFKTTYAAGADPAAIADAVASRLVAATTTDPTTGFSTAIRRVNAAKVVEGGSLAPGFSLSVGAPSPQEVGIVDADAIGATTTYAIALTRTGGFTGEVALSVEDLPAGATGIFNLATLSADSTSSLSVTTASSTPAGAHPFKVRGTSTDPAIDPAVTKTAPATLQVTDVGIAITPQTRDVPAGGSTTYTINITRTPAGSSAAVSLAVSDLPADASGTFSPASPTGTSSTLTVTTAAGTPVGPTTFTVTGTALALGLSRSATAAVTVTAAPDFSLSVTPSLRTIQRGNDPTYTVTVTRLNGFTGAITFSVTGLPAARASASFSPSSTTGNTSTLRISTSSRVARGTYKLVVKGTSGGLTRTAAEVTLQIN